MTSGSAAKRARERQDILDHVRGEQDALARRRRAVLVGATIVGFLVVVGLIAAALYSARPTQSTDTGPAPDFTLPASDGTTVSLAALRGHPVILYFNEGAGCDSCIVQMQKIEDEPGFAADGITVLPIVMNTAEEINAARDLVGVEAPFLLDDGTVSQAYGTLGTGMHEGLPGHGFVLIDAEGDKTWQGDYPSMWLDPAELLAIARERL